MKVLLLNSVSEESSSTGHIVNDIISEIEESGSEGILAYSQPNPAPPDNSFFFGIYIENKIHALLSRVTGLQGYFSIFATKKLIKKAVREKVDIIHIHNLHSNDICFPMLYRFISKRKIPVVMTLHDCWLYTARCFHYTKMKCNQWESRCRKCPGKCRSNDYWFQPRTNKLFTDKQRWYSSLDSLHVVGVSDWIAKEASSSVLRCADDIQVIYNWVDTDTFEPSIRQEARRKLELANKKVVLGVCGHWSVDKGIEDIIKLAERLPENVQLILVGEVPTAYKSQLGNNLHFVDRITDKRELAEVYASADIYINLSLEESFGMTNAEALACGTPVLVYSSTASTEFAQGGCGYAAAPGDLDDLERGLRWILAQPQENMREICRNRALEMYSRDGNVKKYVSLYKSILH